MAPRLRSSRTLRFEPVPSMLHAVRLLAYLFLVVGTQARGQDPAEVLRLEEYCFSLKSPGPGWRLSSGVAATSASPDAQAAMLGPTGIYCAVIVEQVGEVELEVYAQLLLDDMQVEDLQVHSSELVDRTGLDAHQFHFTATVNGVELRFLLTLIIRKGWAYQVAAWGGSARCSVEMLSVVPDAFAFLPGEVTADPIPKHSPDDAGPGWVIRDGVFQSITRGVRIVAPEGWRIVTGEELFVLDEDAFVGLQRHDIDQYVALIGRRCTKRSSSVLMDQLRAQFLEDYAEAPGKETRPAKLLGQNVPLLGCDSEYARPLHLVQGAILQGDYLLEVISWWGTADTDRQECLSAMDVALAGVRLLDGQELATLDAQLSKLPDPQETVGAGFSLRRGVYRDFEHAITWTCPDGYWKLEAGSEARMANSAASLVVEDLGAGISGVLSIEPSESWTQSSFHRTIASIYLPEDSERQETPMELRGGSGLLSSGSYVESGSGLTYQVFTSVKAGTAVQFVIWGESELMTKAHPTVLAMCRGLAHIKPPFRAVRLGKNSYEDLRMGFRLALPGSGWIRRNQTPKSTSSITQVVSWKRNKLEVVALTAGGVIDRGMRAGLEGMIINAISIPRPTGLGMQATGPLTRGMTTLGGSPAIHLAWGDPIRLQVALAVRDNSLHALIYNPEGTRTPITFEQACAAYSFLD